MPPWHELIISIMIFFAMGIVFLCCIVQIFRRECKKLYGISALVSVLIIVGFGIFSLSHKTSFKYNDWKIVNSNINDIRQEYGEFDIGGINAGEEGWVGYYIYR